MGVIDWRKKRRKTEDQRLKEMSSLLWQSEESGIDESGIESAGPARRQLSPIPGITAGPDQSHNQGPKPFANGFVPAANLEAIANSLRERTLHALEAEANDLERRLRASSEASQEMIGTLERLRDEIRSEAEKTEKQIQQASRQAIDSLSQEVEDKLKKALEASSTRFVGQAQEQLDQHIALALEAAEARVTALQNQTLARAKTGQPESEPELSSHVKAALLEEAQAACRTAIEQARDSIHSLESEAVGRIQRVHESQAELAKTFDPAQLERLKPSIEAEIQKCLRKSAEELLGNSIALLQEQARSACQTALNTAVDSIHSETTDALARIRVSSEQTPSNGQDAGLAGQQQPEQSSKAAFEELERKSDLFIGSLQAQLQETVDHLCAKDVQLALDQIHKATEAFLEQSNKQLQKLADDNVKATVEKLNSFQKRLVDETLDQKAAGTATPSPEASRQIGESTELPRLRETLVHRYALPRREMASLSKYFRALDPVAVSRMCLWSVAIAVPLFLLICITVRPVMRLRADPPPDFVAASPEWDSRRRLAEEDLARGYWYSAVRNVQSKYPFGKTLPDQPPPEFKEEDLGQPSFAGTPESRTRYWRRLQRVWVSPQAWQKSYEWNPEWAREHLMSKIQ